jgi:hypothetical protein
MENTLLLVWIVARDDGQGGLRSAQVNGLMRHVRSNQDEIPFLADNRLFQLVAVARIDRAFTLIYESILWFGFRAPYGRDSL